MLTEAMQGAGIVLGAVAVAYPLASRLMQSDAKPPKKPRNLGDGFADVTIRRERWAEKMRKAESHGKAVR